MTTPDPTALAACPFCGGPGDEVGPSLGCSRWRIICDDCGAEGPAHGTEQAAADYVPTEAVTAWNTRAALTRPSDFAAGVEAAAKVCEEYKVEVYSGLWEQLWGANIIATAIRNLTPAPPASDTLRPADSALADELAHEIEGYFAEASNNPCTCNVDEIGCPHCNAWSAAIDLTRQSLATALASEAKPRADDALRVAFDVADAAPELNPSNYDHDQVCELNTAMVELHGILRAALASEEPNNSAKGD